MVNVTQRDRESAWPQRHECYSKTDKQAWMGGHYDDIPLIKAFARHRTADAARIAELEGEVARLKGYAWQVVDTVEQAKDGTWHFVTGDPEQLLSDMMSACDYDPDATTALGGQS